MNNQMDKKMEIELETGVPYDMSGIVLPVAYQKRGLEWSMIYKLGLDNCLRGCFR